MNFKKVEKVITFEATSNFFQKVTPPQTEQARICQLETQLQMADRKAIDIAHFMLKVVTAPSPIEKVTVPEYKKKFKELRKERVRPPTTEGGLSQNFIVKELRPQLPSFLQRKKIEKIAMLIWPATFNSKSNGYKKNYTTFNNLLYKTFLKTPCLNNRVFYFFLPVSLVPL